MRDRIATIGPIAAVAGALGLCRGLPVLLSLGVLGAIAGWSLQSWAPITLGLVLAAVGWTRWARRRQTDRTCDLPVPPTREHASTDQYTNISTREERP